MASMSDTSYWINFFTTARIPAGDAAHYAVMFSDNRITKEMLLDLSKDYLTDMGVTRLGDVIAILRHARYVFDQEAKDKILKSSSLTSLSSSNSFSSSRIQRRSTGTSHVGNHITSKQAETVALTHSSTPRPPSADFPKTRRKVSVFDRLGADGTESTVLLISDRAPVETQPSSVFSRLGGKGAMKRTTASSFFGEADVVPGKSDSLPYAGVLKNPGPSLAKKAKLMSPASKAKTPTKIHKTVKSPKAVAEDKKALYIQRPEVSTTTEGVLSDHAKKEPTSLRDRLGPRTETPSSTSHLSKFRIISAPHLGNSKVTMKNQLRTKVEESPVVSSSEQAVSKLKMDEEVSKVTTPRKRGGVFSRLGRKSE